VGPGETGDLFIEGVRGVSLFAEYAGDPAATAAAFREDGLFITGDRVRLGEDGYLYFADRSKDMLKIGGENVAASEIERVIGAVAGVSEVAVVAKHHDMLDEVPVAFVIAASLTTRSSRIELRPPVWRVSAPSSGRLKFALSRTCRAQRWGRSPNRSCAHCCNEPAISRSVYAGSICNGVKRHSLMSLCGEFLPVTEKGTNVRYAAH
jgi:acyl-CoA synthetase (AMP-forming)/AMP-acid ligase II